MKRRLILLCAAALAVSGVGIGSTLALFTAQTQADELEFAVGQFCFTSERNDSDPVPGPMFYITAEQGATPDGTPGIYPTGLWAPGDTKTRTLTLYNPRDCSTMDGWLTAVSAELADGSDRRLAEKLWVEIETPFDGEHVKVGEARMSDLLDGPIDLVYPDGSKIPVLLGTNRHMKFRVKFDIDAGNEYQDQTLVVHFKLYGEQAPNNP